MVAQTNKQTLEAAELVKTGKMGVTQAAKEKGVHRTSVWRTLRKEKAIRLREDQKK